MVTNPIAGHVQCSAKTNTHSIVKNKYQPDQIKLQQAEAELGQAQV